MTTVIYQKALPLSFSTIEEIKRIRNQFKLDPADEKSARLSLLPSGITAHKVYFKGVLTEVKKTDNGLSGTILDRTGKITVKASPEYQPESYGKIKAIRDLPAFVAIVGRVNLFSPEPVEGQERQTFVSLNLEDFGQISKADRYEWDLDILQLTRDRCSWSDELTESQRLADEIYGPDARNEMLSKIEAAYAAAGVVL